MNKLAKIIIGFVVLVAIAVLVYVALFKKAEAPRPTVPLTRPMILKTYTDPVSGISLKAPAGLAVATSSSGFSLIFATTTPYVHTHLLNELRIDIATPAVDCVSTEGGFVGTSTIVAINGVDFERQNWSDIGAGNLYQGVDYTAVRNSLCYRVGLFTHSTNGEGFYSNDPVQIQEIDALQAVDMKNLFTLFDQIARTIKFTK